MPREFELNAKAGIPDAPEGGAGRGEGRRSRRWRLAAWLAGGIVLYVALGNALHHLVFTLPPPDPATYPRAGDTFASEYEGFELRIVDVVDGWVVVEMAVEPGAVAPPFTTTEGSRRSSRCGRGGSTSS